MQKLVRIDPIDTNTKLPDYRGAISKIEWQLTILERKLDPRRLTPDELKKYERMLAKVGSRVGDLSRRARIARPAPVAMPKPKLAAVPAPEPKLSYEEQYIQDFMSSAAAPTVTKLVKDFTKKRQEEAFDAGVKWAYTFKVRGKDLGKIWSNEFEGYRKSGAFEAALFDQLAKYARVNEPMQVQDMIPAGRLAELIKSAEKAAAVLAPA